MVVILKPDFTQEQLEEAKKVMEAGGVKVFTAHITMNVKLA